MLWSPQQDRALREVSAFMADPDRQVFYLAGYAGTGKTTLARTFAEGIEGSVCFAAFTGKAAYVLRQKGCPGATTIHSLIYISREKSKAALTEMKEALAELLQDLHMENRHEELYVPDEDSRVQELKRRINEEEKALARPMFVLNPDSPVRSASLVIIDECSMVDETIGEDLLSFGTKILVLGDPGQLPPVYGTGYFTSRKPDMVLTEIHRQAAESPILWMATRARLGESIPLGRYGTSNVILQRDVDVKHHVLGCGQILVGKNATRQDSNVRVRQLRWFQNAPYTPYPIAGDRLVCLRNNHETGLLNGAIWSVVRAGDPVDETIGIMVSPEDNGPDVYVTSHTHYFEKRGDKLPWWQKKDAEEFDYGYALTAHKAQGSQWDDVLLFDESHVFRENRNKWLYTAITRAADSLTLVRL